MPYTIEALRKSLRGERTMPLTLTLGPMKSRKTLDLYGRMSLLDYTNNSHAVFHPKRNTRDNGCGVASRAGISIPATKIETLEEYFVLILCPK